MVSRWKQLSARNWLGLARAQDERSIMRAKIDPMGIVFRGNSKYRHHRIGVADSKQLYAGIDVRWSAERIRWLKQAHRIEPITLPLQRAHCMLNHGKRRCVIQRQLHRTKKGNLETALPTDRRYFLILSAEYDAIERTGRARRFGGPLKKWLAAEHADILARYSLRAAARRN